MNLKHETYQNIFGGVYAALMANLLLVVGCAPLLVGLFVTDPARSWPLLAVVTPFCAPAIVGIFAILAGFTAHRSTTVLRTFGRIWRAAFGRAVAVGAMATAGMTVLGADIAWVWGRRLGAIGIPVLAMLMVLVLATTVLALAVLAERPAVRLRDALRASLYLALRRWYLTALSLAVLLLLIQVVATKPAIGLGVVASPLLYVVWANSRFSLRPALDPPAPASASPVPTTRGRAVAAGA